MNAKMAKAVLKCLGPRQAESPDRTAQAALKVASKAPELATAFKAQNSADLAFAEKVAVVVPEDFLDSLNQLSEKLNEPVRKSSVSVKNPAFLTVVLGFVAMVGVGVWLLLAQMDGFPGMEEAIALAKVGDVSQPSQFEALEARAGSLGDWFVMQGFDGFTVPETFANHEVVGVRVFDFEGTMVALAAVPNNRSFFYVFPSTALGIAPGESGHWRILEYGADANRRVMGISQIGDFCFMITFEGDRSEMEAFLQGAAGR